MDLGDQIPRRTTEIEPIEGDQTFAALIHNPSNQGTAFFMFFDLGTPVQPNLFANGTHSVS